MEYAKFLKTHPIPELTQEQVMNGKKQKILAKWETSRLFTANNIDGKLVIIVYRKTTENLTAEYRHIFDGESYATQRINDNKKLVGRISAYLSMYSEIPLDEHSGTILAEYFPDSDSPGIRCLDRAEHRISDAKKACARQRIKDKIDQRMSCFSGPPQDFYDWINKTVLRPFRYFFYNYKRGKTQHGYCSHCKNEFGAEGVKYNGSIICPSCGSELICKSLGMVTQYGFRNFKIVNLVEMVKDGDDEAIAVRCFDVIQNVSGYKDGVVNCIVKTAVSEVCRTFYDRRNFDRRYNGHTDYIYCYGSFMGENGARWCGYTNFSGNMGISYGPIYPGGINAVFADISKLKNVDITAILPYCEVYIESFIENLKKFPVIENLAKQGKGRLIRKILALRDYELKYTEFGKFCNPSERSPAKFLGVDRITFSKMGDISPKCFILYKRLAERGCGFELYSRYAALGLENDTEDIVRILDKLHISPQRLIGYLEKQTDLIKQKGNVVFGLYYDYHSMVTDLKMKRTESVDFPKNISIEHDRLIKLKADKVYSHQNPLLKKRGELLHMLDWSDDNFIIKAFDCAADFLDESAVLGHCVKTYITRCAKGETNIYGIRRADQPDKPYFTLTLSNNAEVITNLGKRNCPATKEVKSFVKKWEKNIVSKNKKEFIRKARKSAS